jgi:LuxR family maltose regulon positive regulatory protein
LEVGWILQGARPLFLVIQFQGSYLEGIDLFLNASRRLEADNITAVHAAALVETLCDYAWLCLRLGRLADADCALARARHVYDGYELSPNPHLEGDPLSPSIFLALARGEYKQAVDLGEQVLHVAAKYALPDASTIPHYGIASAALHLTDFPRAKVHAEQALALAASAGNQRNKTFPHSILGQVALAESDLPAAKRHFEAAYTICNQYGDRGGVAEHLANLAGIALQQHEWREARTLYARSLKVYEEIGDRGGIARTRLGIGIASQKTNEPGDTRLHYRRALAVAVDAQIVPLILSIAAVVGSFLLQTENSQAVGLRALAFVLRHPSCDGQTRQQALDALAALGRATDELPESPDTLVALAAALQAELDRQLEQAPAHPNLGTQPLAEPLTEREIEVLQLLAGGRTNPEIAEALVVTVGTVKSHTSRIFRKLDVSNRTQAVLRVRELGLLT